MPAMHPDRRPLICIIRWRSNFTFPRRFNQWLPDEISLRVHQSQFSRHPWQVVYVDSRCYAIRPGCPDEALPDSDTRRLCKHVDSALCDALTDANVNIILAITGSVRLEETSAAANCLVALQIVNKTQTRNLSLPRFFATQAMPTQTRPTTYAELAFASASWRTCRDQGKAFACK
jgi:hypothetical protein